MENSLYVGLSRQMVLRSAMDMISNNVANVNTPGYRGQNPMFEEYIADPKGLKEPLSMVYDKGQYHTTKAGPIQFTGGTYDVALNGPGFIAVSTKTGETQYTRAGNLTVDNTGTLITQSGFLVSGNGGAPIIIPAGAQDVQITEAGEVVVDNNAIGQIDMVEFDNVQVLKPEGNGLYSSPDPGKPATETIMKQGMVEGSNVQPVIEMTRMIDILRDYQSMQSLIQNEHDRQRNAIQSLGDMNGS